MLVVLRSEAGNIIRQSFSSDDMQGAVKFCSEHPEYGIFYCPEDESESDWDFSEFHDALDNI
jgi:hypothetical protein